MERRFAVIQTFGDAAVSSATLPPFAGRERAGGESLRQVFDQGFAIPAGVGG